MNNLRDKAFWYELAANGGDTQAWLQMVLSV